MRSACVVSLWLIACGPTPRADAPAPRPRSPLGITPSSRSGIDTTFPDAAVVTPLPDAAIDAALPDAAVAMRQCFCFAWVHLDENGDFCYPTRAGCEERFRTFGRTDKLPCRPEQQVSCQRIACVHSGKECFRE